MSKNTKTDVAVVWFRQDLRLSDNPALAYALENHDSVLCLYILDVGGAEELSASDCWLISALRDLDEQLDGRLTCLHGLPEEVLSGLNQEFQISAIYWNRLYDPQNISRDTRLKKYWREQGLWVESFNSHLAVEPWQLLKADKTPYKVFTPYYRALLSHDLLVSAPLSDQLQTHKVLRASQSLSDALKMNLPTWATQLLDTCDQTRDAGLRYFAKFAEEALESYKADRDFLSIDGVSHLSPYLHFGQIGVREILSIVQGRTGEDVFVRQLLWRDFAHYVLFHWPNTLDQSMDKRFEQIAWSKDRSSFDAWRLGCTGIPVVDAGMRELWQTGAMHNRVRMIVASFLTKHLQHDWRLGADWFMQTLFDADLANNTMGWQWVAGCGVDAAPYFRVFNPVTQGQKFDAYGDYVCKWVPELKDVPKKWIHSPWLAPQEVLDSAGVKLGESYPFPIIDLADGRKQALEAWDRVKNGISV